MCCARFGEKSPIGTIHGTLESWTGIPIASEISAPTLILNGHYDWSDEAVEPFISRIPVVEWVHFDDSSHTMLFEEPKKFIDVVSRHLTRASVNTLTDGGLHLGIQSFVA